MEPPGEPSVLARLERSELDARARRLTAAARAERILTDARERAAAIDAQEQERVAWAVEQLRVELRSGADEEIDAIGRVEPDPEATSAGDQAARFGAAVELVVAAVLGEVAAFPATAVDRAVRPARQRIPSAGPPCS